MGHGTSGLCLKETSGEKGKLHIIQTNEGTTFLGGRVKA
jgi:hypothetical protein